MDYRSVMVEDRVDDKHHVGDIDDAVIIHVGKGMVVILRIVAQDMADYQHHIRHIDDAIDIDITHQSCDLTVLDDDDRQL